LSSSRQVSLNPILYHSNHKNQKNHSSDKKQFLI
jgi:hypothetical protein